MVLYTNEKAYMPLARNAIAVLEYNAYSSPKNVLLALSVVPTTPNIPVEATLSLPVEASSLCLVVSSSKTFCTGRLPKATLRVSRSCRPLKCMRLAFSNLRLFSHAKNFFFFLGTFCPFVCKILFWIDRIIDNIRTTFKMNISLHVVDNIA